MNKPSGTIIDDRYEIESLIGVGGMSAVYRVKDLALDRISALKMLHPHITENRANVERFLQEAKAEGLINHPNVINVRAVGATPDGQLYLVMDHLEGKSLADWIKDEPLTNSERARDIFVQICKGLQAAHDHGVIHRDLKPSNVMLVGPDDAPVVKLVDFGIAKLFGDATKEVKLTKAGSVLGSPSYMSPEQCDAKPVDSRSDIYSLGCLMYEVLTGVTPFDAESDLEVMCKHVGEEALPLTERAPWAPAEWDAVVLKCLQKDPEGRYQSVADLQRDIEAIEFGIVAGAAKPRRRVVSVKIAAGIAAAGLALIGAGALVMTHLPKASPVGEPQHQSEIQQPHSAVDEVRRLFALHEKYSHSDSDRLRAQEVADAIFDLYFNQRAELLRHPELFPMIPDVVSHAGNNGLFHAQFLSDLILQYGGIGTAHKISLQVAETAGPQEDDSKAQALAANALSTVAKTDILMDQLQPSLDHAIAAAKHYGKVPGLYPEAVMRLTAVVKMFDSYHRHDEAGQVQEAVFNLVRDKTPDDKLALGSMAFDRALQYRKIYPQADYAHAQTWYDKSLQLRREGKASRSVVWVTTFESGSNLQAQGRLKEAKARYDECLVDIDRFVPMNATGEQKRIALEMARLYDAVGEKRIAANILLRAH